MKSKVKWLTFLLTLAVALGACGQRARKMPKILVSPKGLVHNFWLTVKAGADSAGKEFSAEVIWKGPAQETDVAGQMAILEDYINKRVDAIVLAACDTKALNPLIDRAMDSGIPVVTIDSGVDYDRPLSFIATDNIKGAMEAARVLAELIGYKGKVACIPHVPGAATAILREQGFLEGIKSYPDIKVVAVQYSQSDVAIAMAVMENILTAHPDLDGVFAANEAGAIGCTQALVSRGLAGKVKLVAFDASPNQIEALQRGYIQALIVQDPFKMGYLGVKYALDAMAKKEIPKRVDTGVYVVTKENFSTPEIQRIVYPLGEPVS